MPYLTELEMRLPGHRQHLADFVWLEHTRRPCAAHARTPLHGALHVSLLKK